MNILLHLSLIAITGCVLFVGGIGTAVNLTALFFSKIDAEPHEQGLLQKHRGWLLTATLLGASAIYALSVIVSLAEILQGGTGIKYSLIGLISLAPTLGILLAGFLEPQWKNPSKK